MKPIDPELWCYRYMESKEPSVFTSTYSEGIQRVLQVRELLEWEF